MKSFLRIFLTVCCLFLLAQVSFADNFKVLVLPDNVQFDSTNYLIYPDSSVIFASDTINELKKYGKIQTVSMTEIRDALRKNTKLSILTRHALNEFKYNYNIPFVDFKEISSYFSTDKVLIITSQTDVQNYFLKRTIWDFLNIPGATVIDPTYKLSTYVALIDVNKELVIWDNTYYKNIGAMENRMVAQSFAPATEQLAKIKQYSSLFLSQNIAWNVQSKMFLGNPEGETIDVSNMQKPVESVIPLSQEVDLESKSPAPKRDKSNIYGEVINDL